MDLLSGVPECTNRGMVGSFSERRVPVLGVLSIRSESDKIYVPKDPDYPYQILKPQSTHIVSPLHPKYIIKKYMDFGGMFYQRHFKLLELRSSASML